MTESTVPTITITDPKAPPRQRRRQVKLGRKPPHEEFEVLEFGDYYIAERDKTPPPASTNWRAKADAALKQVYGNDRYGDCVIAGKYHLIGVATGNEEGMPTIATDQDVLGEYERICGPGDNGCVITDVLDAWAQGGLKLGNRQDKIDGYAAVDTANKLLVQVCVEIFGGITLGINLPGNWTCTNCTWGPPAGGVVGGHDVPIVDYDENGVYISTWGGLVQMSWDVLTANTPEYIEEAWVSLPQDWYSKGELAPNGIDVAALKADLAEIKGGQIPDPGPNVNPPPPPPPDEGNMVVIKKALAEGGYKIVPAQSKDDGSRDLPPELVEIVQEVQELLQAGASPEQILQFLQALKDFLAAQGKGGQAGHDQGGNGQAPKRST